MDTKIVEQVKADAPKLKADLTYLTEHIGPRLTGSAKLEQASHWTAEQFKAAGLSNVNLEPWTIANSWTRGQASGRLVLPAEQSLTLASAGWSPSSNGPVRGPVVGVTFEKIADLDQYKGKLRGAIVLLGRPRQMEAPGFPLSTPWAQGTIPLAHPVNEVPIDPAAYRQARMAAMKMFAEEKVNAVLISSVKEFGLLTMSVASREYQSALVPTAYSARENYELLWNLQEQGPAQAEVSIGGSFSGKPVEVYNTVAEIPGTEKPEEIVILGAHLDSWDLGTGATDNGTGSMAVLAAARALQKVGVKPKRTIRFVLFTGEEQGLNGSRAYVKAHKDELPKISGILVHDSGTGKVLTVGLMGNYAVRETIDHALYPLAKAKDIGLVEPSLRREGGSDHVPFDDAGVPGFWCVQDVADYDKMHHSQSDRLEHVRWSDLTEGAQVLAVFAYNVAKLPEMLPRKPAKETKTE
ncbi:MAG TPA: M20/M25/M40 family metallo-hydrolase [Candidatus Acidoferrum sp.]|nr:M20/M25/M40 family metallo-hydrolase [Candidatus Acidoferrum sp.]